MNEEIRQTKNDFSFFRSKFSDWSDGILDKLFDDLLNSQIQNDDSWEKRFFSIEN